MKIRHSYLLILLFVIITFIPNACTELGTDIQDRINDFAGGLNNSDRSTINANFDQAETKDLPSMSSAWWASNFPPPPDSDHQYRITLIDYSNPSDVVAAITGPPAFNSFTGVPVSAVFVMSKEGPDWFIEQLYLGGSSTPVIQ